MPELVVTMEDTATGRDLTLRTEIDLQDAEILDGMPSYGSNAFDFVMNLIAEQLSVEWEINESVKGQGYVRGR